ncbi:hypothetical protein [Flammeovirga agarivorans]|uniref:Uncharacterized protein n=1 Tax=Flammeovirga agarivorans TaxID=2726742 RepID=A0A7X8SR88_9BACT|nr:hypothetical protein [Flammeovirga agarivorans]NLR94881.1 hypothetical protein [Flammeovirga agarivorans]
MITNSLTLQRFLALQSRVHKEVENSPFSVRLHIRKALPSENGFKNFIGEVEVVEKSYTINCLYNKQSQQEERREEGRFSSSTADIMISPIQLNRIIGSTSLDNKNLRVEFLGKEYFSPKITLEDELYNSCLAIRIELESNKQLYNE